MNEAKLPIYNANIQMSIKYNVYILLIYIKKSSDFELFAMVTLVGKRFHIYL